MKKNLLIWSVLLVLVESLSVVAAFQPVVSSVFAVAFAVILLIVTIIRPEMGLAALLLEYTVGSKGGYFKFGADTHADGGVLVRILLFAAFFLGWCIWSLRYQTWRVWRTYVEGRKHYLFLLLAILYAIFLGWLHHARFLWSDANAWGAWLLLLPVLDIVRHRPEASRRAVFSALSVGLVWLPIKTLLLLYLFSHGWAVVGGAVYFWVRRTGVGEITAMGEGAFRVFLQSQIYAVFAVLAVTAWQIYNKTVMPRWARALFVVSLAEIIASLSRSFWIGLAGAGLVLLTDVVRRKLWLNWSRAKMLLGGVGLSLCLVVAVVLFPWPSVQPIALWQMFAGRVQTNEQAAISRWQLLPILWHKIQEQPIFGSGFGATVTYQSRDPRAVQTTGGTVTTYAFEWGWLEHWVKFGVVGIPLMLYLLWSLAARAWKSSREYWMKMSVIASVIALALVHVFTPYLNHPLGIVALIMVESLLVWQGSRDLSLGG